MAVRRLRLWLAMLVGLGLAPGTFVRTDTGTRQDVAEIAITPVALPAKDTQPLEITGAWELASRHGWFGGFSALVADGQGLIAGSDRGFLLDLDLRGASPRAVSGSFRYVGTPVSGRKEMTDLEGMARDPVTGTLWAAFENYNVIKRFAPDGTASLVQPPALYEWQANSGPEMFARLSDGSFVTVAEEGDSDDLPGRPAFRWPADPITEAEPAAFRFALDADYAPVDATQLPDGRVAILLRRATYAIPVRFATGIAIADPRSIRAGEAWRAQVIWRLTAPDLKENYEGIAFIPDAADPARGDLWLIADDNFSIFQRNLLLRLAWRGEG